MEPYSAPGGFLGAFVLVGILLPITASFVGDGIVYLLRGRGPVMFLWSAILTGAIFGLASMAMGNADLAGQTTDLSGAIGLILCFSVPVALAGFGLRMLALRLNPMSRAADMAAIGARIAKEDARRERAAHRSKHVAKAAA